MGFWGGAFDLLFQRLIEVWSNVPFLYVIMIVASIMVPTFWTLAIVMVVFGWMSMTWYMRTATYKEKARDYVMAARALGATSGRIIARHVLPNTVSIIVTFIPFAIATGITSLTALDYLGFGLPPPTPSWGDLLSQGTDNLDRPWIVTSVVAAMVLVLLTVTYVGEAVREAFDPKRFTYYE
jgi:microcin C transport system permease protein